MILEWLESPVSPKLCYSLFVFIKFPSQFSNCFTLALSLLELVKMKQFLCFALLAVLLASTLLQVTKAHLHNIISMQESMPYLVSSSPGNSHPPFTVRL